MARPDFTLKWAGSRVSIPPISAGNYAAGWDTYLGPLPPLGDDHDYVMNLQDSRAIWLGEQMLLAVGHEWQADVSYDLYAIVRSPVDGQLYRSLVGGNLGNEPSVSGAQWAPGVADDVDYLNTVRINVASASNVDLTTSAPDTRHINITGTTTINGFTVAAGQCYFVRFDAALTLTNSANIVTQSGANITTAAGDTCVIRATADGVVEILLYVKASTVLGKNQCTAWVNFNGTGAVAIRDSFNVSSITDNGTGNYTVNFLEPMNNADYAPNVSVQTNSSGDNRRSGTVDSYTVSSVTILTGTEFNSSITLQDMPSIFMTVFGGK